MTQKVRYRKLSEGVYESTRVFLHFNNGAQYKVFVNYNDNFWQVVDANLEITAASGHNTDKVKLQKEVRTALEKLGVFLEKGTRKRLTKNKEQ